MPAHTEPRYLRHVEVPRVWIHAARRHYRGAQSAWARASGVSRSTLTRMLNSENPNPRATTFLKLMRGAGLELRVLDTSVSTLDDALVIIERARGRQNKTVVQIASELPLDVGRLRRVLAGRAQPTAWQLLALFEIVGCPLSRAPSP